MRWIDRIIIAIILIGIGFIIGRQPTVASVENFIVGGLSLGLVVELGGLLRELFKERREERAKERKKLEDYIQEHNKKLIDTVIKHWYTIPSYDITCRMKSIDTVIKPWYEDNFVTINEPFTTEHLQTGYADIWKLRQESKTLINDLLSEDAAIKEYIRNKLAPGVPQFGFTQDFTVENVEAIIYNEIKTFSNKGGVPENYRAELSLFGYRVEDNEKYLVDKKEIFRKSIETIIKDKTLYEMFEKINRTRKLSHKKIDELYQGLKQIAHDFEERHIELKGTCKDCKGWHDKLTSLK